MQQAARRYLARKIAAVRRQEHWGRTALLLQRQARRILARRYTRLRSAKMARIAEVRVCKGGACATHHACALLVSCLMIGGCGVVGLWGVCCSCQDAGVIARLARHSRMVMEELESTSVGVELAFATALKHMPGSYVSSKRSQ